jgi:hypothetical protein
MIVFQCRLYATVQVKAQLVLSLDLVELADPLHQDSLPGIHGLQHGRERGYREREGHRTDKHEAQAKDALRYRHSIDVTEAYRRESCQNEIHRSYINDVVFFIYIIQSVNPRVWIFVRILIEVCQDHPETAANVAQDHTHHNEEDQPLEAGVQL